MSIVDSIIIGIFVMCVVFAVLVALSFLVRVQSAIMLLFENRKTNAIQKQETSVKLENSTKSEVSTGELTLIGVDERTAAMVMAIISDQINVPLSDLRFNSIRALD